MANKNTDKVEVVVLCLIDFVSIDISIYGLRSKVHLFCPECAGTKTQENVCPILSFEGSWPKGQLLSMVHNLNASQIKKDFKS